MKSIINTHEAPAPIGPYSQAVMAGNTLYLSGQVAIEPGTGAMIQESIALETKRVMENISALLKKAGMDFQHIVKTTIFLQDLQDFNEVNTVYGSFFKGDFPARETVQVAGLPKGARVEISVIAVKD